MSTFFLGTPFLPIVFLLGSLLLTICNTALIQLGRHKSKNMIHPLFSQNFENLYFSISLSKQIYQLLYAVSFFFFLFSTYPSIRQTLRDPIPDFIPLLLASCLIVGISIILDFVVRMLAVAWSKTALKIAFPPAFFYIALFFPISIPFIKLAKKLVLKLGPEEVATKTPVREILRESELQSHLELSDQKLISSFINFKERVAKEIMVPRIDLFSLSSDTTIREATRLFSQEGYSRIPIYEENLDHIIGVVLYKDLLKCYTSPDQNLDAPLGTIAKQVLYSPENKKVSQLLQEFRNQQIHMAIVVDEYGGTEGIVTIEDILEELVGEIEDEYDIGEENQFIELPGGGWIIDAKMTLLDIESQIGIHIPTHPEYETLGGYVYHCAGTIPSKGWRLSHDQFDLEVISSNERAIKKIKIIPRYP
ncbi:MAG TPA: hemolysin family protein [Chlamydiales bacterium]|nr:hemolysin family protein [Chlamydiales bacterium]